MLKAVIFDLDGTLLSMNEDEFTKGYFSLLCKKLSKFGYEPNELINVVWQGTKSMINYAYYACWEDLYLRCEEAKEKL